MLSPPAVASLQTFPKPFSFLYDSVNLSWLGPGADRAGWAGWGSGLGLAVLGSGAGREGRAGKGLARQGRVMGQARAQLGRAGGLAWQGRVLGQLGKVGQARAWLGRNKAIADERLVRDIDHMAVVENASFESGCDFDTQVVQGVMWH
ncbi:hypothetical protein BY996DRAFT_6471124 [Phakopsora pachyrhizi]|nr:hypothetical protein BY996DRAFT_6471124 [Phakopsora pachyrhizi]